MPISSTAISNVPRFVRVSSSLSALWCVLLIVCPAGAEPVTVIGFNVESGGSKPQVVARLIGDVQGCDIWGFAEVQNAAWAAIFEKAAEEGENADFNSFLGTTGGGDRLLVVYNADRIECVRHYELSEINIGGNVRAPLVGLFRLKSTGQSFLFMVNHLYRKRANERHRQAELLNDWARRQDLPVIAVGDYNFDWSVSGGETRHDRGYDLLTADRVFRWIRPQSLIKTQCSSHDSVLDFVFVSGEIRDWPVVSDILAPEQSYCPDDDTTSDHRPVRAVFEFPEVAGPSAPAAKPSPREVLQQRIDRLEAELAALREALRDTP